MSSSLGESARSSFNTVMFRKFAWLQSIWVTYNQVCGVAIICVARLSIARKSFGQRYFIDFDLGHGVADNSRHAIALPVPDGAFACQRAGDYPCNPGYLLNL